MYKKYLLTLILVFLTACGFHLKGLGDGKMEISELYLRNLGEENIAFSTLERALKDNGVNLLENEKEGALLIVVADFYSSSRQTATGSSKEDSREIEINDGYELRIIKDDKVLNKTTLNARTNIQYQSNQYLGNERELEESHKQLAEENANSALRFINSTLKKIK